MIVLNILKSKPRLLYDSERERIVSKQLKHLGDTAAIESLLEKNPSIGTSAYNVCVVTNIIILEIVY